MNQPMLKRQLNPFLIASTVLVLSLLAGLSVMYQGHLDNVTDDQNALETQLEEKDQRIAELENETSTLESQLENTTGDLNQYSQLYEQAQSERDELENEVDVLEDTIQQKNNEIDDLTEERDSLASNLTRTRNDITSICNADENQTLNENSETICDYYTD